MSVSLARPPASRTIAPDIARNEQEHELPREIRRPSAAVACSALLLSFALGCKPTALSHLTRHASPQAVNRTGTTPCCRLQSRFPTRRRANPVLTKNGRFRIASPDQKRSDRKKVWVCFR
jgi:hypothetical protein